MTLHVLSSLAFAAMLERVGPGFEAASGLQIEATLLPTALLLPRIRAGERGDVVLLTAAGVDALVSEGVVAGASRRDVARSSVGIAVRAGAPKPAIETVEALLAALLAAGSVGLSRAGASGLFFEGVLTRLGIADAVHAKAVVIESGYTGELAASGRVELAVQQLSELMMVAGVDVVGPLPPELGGESVFSGGVFVGSAQAAAAAALLAAVADGHVALRACGLAPI